MTGFARLQTADDLRRKLRHDLERVRAEPFNAYHAFDFCVTADHLLDWRYPGKSQRAARETARRDEPLLSIVNDLSVGAKHFLAEAPHHDPANLISATGSFDHRHFSPSHFSPRHFDFGRLKVKLSEKAAALVGSPALDVVAFAERVVAYWNDQSL